VSVLVDGLAVSYGTGKPLDQEQAALTNKPISPHNWKADAGRASSTACKAAVPGTGLARGTPRGRLEPALVDAL